MGREGNSARSSRKRFFVSSLLVAVAAAICTTATVSVAAMPFWKVSPRARRIFAPSTIQSLSARLRPQPLQALPHLLGNAGSRSLRDRREVLSSILPAVAAGANALVLNPGSAFARGGAAMDADAAREVVGKSGVALAEALKDWDRLTVGGGDSVRRVLGTAGTSSPLSSLTKAMKSLTAEDPDLMDQVEAVEQRRREADFLAYSSIFCGTAAGGGTGGGIVRCDVRYLMDAHDEVTALKSELQQLLRSL